MIARMMRLGEIGATRVRFKSDDDSNQRELDLSGLVARTVLRAAIGARGRAVSNSLSSGGQQRERPQ